MILTKFIRAHWPEQLTLRVQEEEHDGWTYVGLAIGSDMFLVAVLQREAPRPGEQTEPAGVPFPAEPMRGSRGSWGGPPLGTTGEARVAGLAPIVAVDADFIRR